MMFSLFLWFFGNFLAANSVYEGCFKTPLDHSFIPINTSESVGNPENCWSNCINQYAAMMKEQHCYCISNYTRDISNNCEICRFDENRSCGSSDSMSVYIIMEPHPPTDVKVIVNDNKAVIVTWKPPEIPNGNVNSYSLNIYFNNRSFTIIKIDGGSSNSTSLNDLRPGEEYTISLKALNDKGQESQMITTNLTVPIGPPNKPKTPRIAFVGDRTIEIVMFVGSSYNGPVSAYQVAIVTTRLIPPVGRNISYLDYYKAKEQGINYYITAELPGHFFGAHFEQSFIIGDGEIHGGYYNAPLEAPFLNPQIMAVVVSRKNDEVLYSYSNPTGHAILHSSRSVVSHQSDTITIGLAVATVLLGILLVVCVVGFLILKHRHERIRMSKLPEQQELTDQGPLHEADNMAYIPEDIPERPNHYQNLKTKVWNIPKNFLNVEPTILRRGRFGAVQSGIVQDKHGVCSRVIVHSIADQSLRASEKRHMLRDLDVCIRTGTMKYLTSFVGNCETPDTLYVVLEATPYDLKTRLLAARSGQVFPFEHILDIGSSIASGLKFLEAHKIVHSHLCARSIGLTEDFVPKISGFGMGKHSIPDVKLARWTAPERFGHKKHQPGVVWAFGVVIWEIMSMGGTPYSDLEDECDVEEAVVEKFVRLPQLRDMPDPVYEVLLSCWQVDSEERPIFDELVRLNTLSICPITAITEPYIAELELN